MTTTIATKADLLLAKQDLQLVKQELLTKMAGLATHEETQAIRAEISKVTIRLGSGMLAVTGLLFVALKLTS